MSDNVVEVEMLIEVPIADLFALAMDPQTTLEWVTIAKDVKDVKGGPTDPGFEMKQQLCLRGVPFWVTWELVEVDAPHFARYEGKGPMRSKAIIENRLTEQDGGTLYSYKNEFRAPFGPLGSTAQRVLAGGIPEREARASLENLKKLAETRVGAKSA